MIRQRCGTFETSSRHALCSNDCDKDTVVLVATASEHHSSILKRATTCVAPTAHRAVHFGSQQVQIFIRDADIHKACNAMYALEAAH